MVAATTLKVEESASDATNKQRVINGELHHCVQLCPPLLKQLVQLQVKSKSHISKQFLQTYKV